MVGALWIMVPAKFYRMKGLNRKDFYEFFLIFSSLIIGFLTSFSNPSSISKMEPFTGQLFYGCQILYLLLEGTKLRLRFNFKKDIIIVFLNFIYGIIGLFVARFLGLGPGNALLFCILCTSFQMNDLSYLLNFAIGPFIYMSLVNTIIPINPDKRDIDDINSESSE